MLRLVLFESIVPIHLKVSMRVMVPINPMAVFPMDLMVSTVPMKPMVPTYPVDPTVPLDSMVPRKLSQQPQ